MVDVTQDRLREQELERSALFDDLTGLPNRTLLGERLRLVCEPPRDAGALMMVDLDGFKLINDQLGHSAGDDLLVAVARRLRQHVPSGSTLARLGGDEFAVLVPDTTDEVAGKLATAMCESVAEPFPTSRCVSLLRSA